MFFPDAGTQFLSDQIEHYVIAASSQLPCPSCLTGLMECTAATGIVHDELPELDGRYDVFECASCDRHILIERVA